MRTLILFLVAVTAVFAADSSSFQVVSATNPKLGVAPDSLATIYGSNLATVTASSPLPWPTRLGDISVVLITDSMSVQKMAQLAYVSPTQMNIWIPSGLAPGLATVAFPFTGLPPGEGAAALRIGQVNLQNTAPGLFSADGSGTGVAAATGIRLAIPTPMQFPVDVFTCTKTCVADPIDVGIDRPVYVTFYGTGIRGGSNVVVTIGNVQIQPSYVGPQPDVPGLDQINVPLTLNLRGAGLVNVTITVDGMASNAVQIAIQ
jgi:uncharacterized protein (TIGR03437 family)